MMTPLTYEILLALADADRHGYGIIKEIEGREGEGVAPSTGALYLALQRIDASGVTLGVWWFPFIWLVWVGGILTGVAVLWSRLVKKPARDDLPIRDKEPARQAGGDGS